jgi:hypothetical protein
VESQDPLVRSQFDVGIVEGSYTFQYKRHLSTFAATRS